eukprot:gnl/TRDRNA2_/TRDRNA2_154010_c0_seq2.p1 gnl/TRDRNA2_/TRDRNA2_154010_c0~~gnl/TRDRNA2_/TRDRNA2_154010_c0_seq2.p1  ORF type:complete len:272 (+),score=41.41 gnl/TRDRNA2_/TRDRNA2_154010_c0_seq2:91-816(+)
MAGEDILVADPVRNGSDDPQVNEVFFVCDGECQAYVNTAASNKTSACLDHEALASDRKIHVSSCHASGSSSSEWSDVTESIETGTAVRSSTADCFRSGVENVTGRVATLNDQTQEDLPLSRRWDLTARRTVSFGTKESYGEVVMLFAPGSVFGVEHLVHGRTRYNVRCSFDNNCRLYVLAQSVVAEAASAIPEIAETLQMAISKTIASQMIRTQIKRINVGSMDGCAADEPANRLVGDTES